MASKKIMQEVMKYIKKFSDESKASGDRGIVAESTSTGIKERAKRKVALEARIRKGNASEKDKAKFKAMVDKDAEDASRAARAGAATKRANALKEAGKDKRDPRDTFVQTGELVGDYTPTKSEINQAKSNLEARGMTPAAREKLAIIEKNYIKRKSGGRVAPKGCGKALRGYGKAMKGK